MDRQGDIEALLTEIEREQGVRIFYAAESGSRAWGFASPDSDYDIRFLYGHPQKSYLGVVASDETINLPIEDDLDPEGWDIKKAARLLAKSNGALIEWLHSPITYRVDQTFLKDWRAAARAMMSVRDLAGHYRGLAKQMWFGKLAGEDARAKDYLYALRAVFSAEYVLQHQVPAPVAFEDVRTELPDMISPQLQSSLESLLNYKSASGEKERMERVPVLDDYIASTIERLNRQLESLPRESPKTELADELFRRSVCSRHSQNQHGAEQYSLQRVRQKDVLLLDFVAGSHAYGTAVDGSDVDRRGVFTVPTRFLQGLNHVDQVSDEKSDEVYYELGRLMDLLVKNNPNAMEMLGVPEDCIRYRHPVMDLLKPEIFLSKLCEQTFGGYAMAQIRKARGLNKKIVNPEPETRKNLLDFCHVLHGQGSVPVIDWLQTNGMEARHCGLVAAKHAPHVYALFDDPSGGLGYRGLLSPKDDAALLCSSVPKDAKPVAWMTCNLDAFKAHCRKYREYWQWVELRNEQRYQTNAGHGRGYDSKNLMHTLRLLDVAEEIAREGVVHVRRKNREFLLRVRNGDYDYDYLVSLAEDKLLSIQQAYRESALPDKPNRGRVNELLVEMRTEFSN